MNRFYVSRLVAIAFWIAALVGILVYQGLSMIEKFGSTRAEIMDAFMFTVIGMILSWVINMLYKSNRDTAIHEMGEVEMQTFGAAIAERLNDRIRAKGTYEIGLEKKK